MKRPVLIWIAFGLCLLVGAAAMGWLALTVSRLDLLREATERQNRVEERVRLALWRMDAALGNLVAREGMRPHYMYTAFYPAEQAYTRLYAQLEEGDVLVPSPLLTFSSPHIRLHFQIAPDRTLTSPQAPEGNMRDLAEVGYVEHEQVSAAFATLDSLKREVGVEALLSARPLPVPFELGLPTVLSNMSELVARDAQMLVQRTQAPQKVILQNSRAEAQTEPPWNEGDLAPVWVADELFLLRRVTLESGTVLQGCWLDWGALQPWLLDSIRDLLPEAQLAPLPVRRASQGRMDRRLAALPLLLEPGNIPEIAGVESSPTRIFLAAALASIAVATLAVAALLRGALMLSERRGAFVSAVTHELRTPLTTFLMYTEMLAEGKVRDEAKRQRYLETLHAESKRLAHLVENVLAYARLERRPLAARLEVLDSRVLLDAVVGPLEQRARAANMELVVATPADTPPVRVDRDAVERVLFNLVDNACKYAAKSEDRRIHLTLTPGRRHVAFRVCDHGPGIDAAERRRIFRPFTKASRDAAHATPGVGLGLGLSRRLARAMGGRLTALPVDGTGACFELRLPVGRSAELP
jgi:signal transduction histidine kinase